MTAVTQISKMMSIVALCFIYYGSLSEADTNTTTTFSPLSTTTDNSSTPASSNQSSTTFSTATMYTTHYSATTNKPVNDHLYCYHCSATSPDQPCETDTAGMINDTTKAAYIKDCNASFPAWKNLTCMIQTMEIGGKIALYYRDCYNGSYFPQSLTSPRFFAAGPNNRSTCDLVGDKLVCFQHCDASLCNGPQPPPPPNKTYPCADYDPYGSTLPPGVECGARGMLFTSDPVSRLINIILPFILVMLTLAPVTMIL